MTARWTGVALRTLVVVVGLLAAVELVVLRPHPTTIETQVTVAAGLAMFLGGVLAWAPGTARFGSRCGLLCVGAGVTWFLDQFLALATAPTLVVLSAAIAGLWLTFLVHATTTFPDGRSAPGLERLVIAYAYVSGPLWNVLVLVALAPPGAGTREELLGAANADPVVHIVDAAIGLVLVVGVMAVLVRRIGRATPAARWAFVGVWSAGLVLVLGGAAVVLGDLTGSLDPAVGYDAVVSVLAAIVPVALCATVLRSRLGRVAALVVSLRDARTGVQVRDAVADALQDPTLDIRYPRVDAEGWVDDAGRPSPQPGPDAALIARDGRTVAAVVHDPALRYRADLLAAVTAAARLSLENVALRADLLAQLAEVRTSRARIVDAADAERRRVERNLHDGAQQHLLLASATLGRVRSRNADPELAPLIDDAAEATRAAHAELRELARGLHPPLLTSDGLDAAFEALADRLPLPVAVIGTTGRRLPPTVEATAYYVVAEALTNSVKHAAAPRTAVRVQRGGGRLEIEVADDGAGGAAPEGPGLQGLADRLAALGGRLEITARPVAARRCGRACPCASPRVPVDLRARPDDRLAASCDVPRARDERSKNEGDHAPTEQQPALGGVRRARPALRAGRRRGLRGVSGAVARVGDEGTVEDWHREWQATAERVRRIGEECAVKGHRRSAYEAFLRASTYHRVSYFPLYVPDRPAARRGVRRGDPRLHRRRAAGALADRAARDRHRRRHVPGLVRAPRRLRHPAPDRAPDQRSRLDHPRDVPQPRAGGTGSRLQLDRVRRSRPGARAHP